MGNDESQDRKDTKKPEETDAPDIDGLVDDVDENAQTVIFQRAINPDEIRDLAKESEETKIIHTIDAEAVKRMLSEEELNRIVDEVGSHGALPMDTLPSAVEKDDPKDKK